MRGQFPLVRPDGTRVVIEYSAAANVAPGLHLSALRDATLRVDAERDAAQALHEADVGRRKLEAVLAALPVAVWLTDPDGRLLEANPAAAAILRGGASLDADPTGLTQHKGFWPRTGKRIEPGEWGLSRALATGHAVVAEPVDIERFDGTRGHALNSAAVIRDERGEVIGGVVVMLDVSSAHAAAQERERLIGSLEFERRRLGTLLDKAPAFMAVLRGKEHVIELVNEAYAALMGQGRMLVGKPLMEAAPELASQGVQELLDGVIGSGAPFVSRAYAVCLRRSDGAEPECRYLDLVCQPLFEPDGPISGVFVHGVDVTQATLTQRRIAAQFHGVPVPTYVWQREQLADGRHHFVLIDFNAAALTASSGRIENKRGASSLAFFAEQPAMLEDLDRCHAGETLRREISWTSRSTGQTQLFFASFAPAPPDLVIVHTEDVTSRLKLEQQLAQSQKMEAVGQLAGGVAHDFNNLLTVILGYTSLALDGLPSDDPLRHDIEQIEAAGRRATDLTRQLLAFSRQQVLEQQVLDLDALIDDLKPMLGRLLGADVELTVITAPDAGRIVADRGQLEQVVMNLAVNARDAMPQGGKLTIEICNIEVDSAAVGKPDAVLPGPFVKLVVSDNGVGMDEATVARVFEPYFTTKESGRGTGLGLSTVIGIVLQSGGFVTVASERGRGTKFQICLPRTDLDAQPTRSVPVTREASGSETILLVEDEDQLRDVAATILRRHGYTVVEASNAGEALLASNETQGVIHLLLTDVVMPRVSGRKLAEQLAHLRPMMKVLYASGYTDDVVLRHGVLESSVAFLQKPFTPSALLGKVREVLDSR